MPLLTCDVPEYLAVKTSGFLKWLMIPLAFLVVYVGIKVFTGSSSNGPNAGRAESARLSPREMKALGVEGDTPRDTVATLVAEVKQLRNDVKSALQENVQQKKDNDRLHAQEAATDQRVQSAIDAEHERAQQEREKVTGAQEQTQALLQELQRKFEHLSQQSNHPDLPIGLGLEDGDGGHFDDDAIHWIEPQGTLHSKEKVATSHEGASLDLSHVPSSFASTVDRPADSVQNGLSGVQPEAVRTPPNTVAKPVYTLPANATLLGSTAMTALIGRVPIDGTVNDPYPFKVLIGAENLAANGITLPDVAGAVVSGTASGDWTLSCVRGYVRSITFVFHDGTIRTVGASTAAATEGEGGEGFRSGMGWISDPYGIPCVSGQRRSNAAQYLGSEMLITAAGAGAASLIHSNSANVSYISGSSGNTLGTVGISGNEAMGRILAGGVQEMSQWVSKLYGQAFAAVYVPPGARVAVHLERSVEIDFDPHGRKVAYRNGEDNASDLD